jgi:hypothetical protein
MACATTPVSVQWAVLGRLYQLIPWDVVQFDELDPQGHRTRSG